MFRRIYLILKRTGAFHILFVFIAVMIISSIILVIVEPDIKTFGDALWYSFVASATIGFGDLYAVTFIGRIITVIVSMLGILTTAVSTGVILSYYMEFLKDKQDDTISMFLEKLEKLPDLSKEELRDISEKVKKLNSK